MSKVPCRNRFRSCVFLLLAAMFVSCACSGTRQAKAKPKNAQALIRDLNNNRGDEATRIAAARQLSRFGDEATATALIQALADDSLLVETAAAMSLGDSKDPRTPDALWAAIQDTEHDPRFRLAAARSLAKLNDGRAAGPLIESLPVAGDSDTQAIIDLGPAAMPALVSALRRYESRQSAARLLIRMGGDVNALIPLLDSKESRYSRVAAARVLAESDNPRATEALKKAINERDFEMSAAAYRFLIRQGGPDNQTRLISTLKVYGNQEMAADFVSSGNAKLKEEAIGWASTRNVPLPPRVSDLPEVHWPGTDPEVRLLALFHFDHSLNSTAGTQPAESSAVSYVAGKWATAVSVDKNGVLKYPVEGNIDFSEGSVEFWIAPKLNGSDPVFSKYNHALLLYQSKGGSQFLVSEATFGGFYAGTVVRTQYVGLGGGKIAAWKSGQWHHIAFTYSDRSSRQRFYVDGQLIAETKVKMPSPELDAGGAFTVGSDPWKDWTGFFVDELQISSGEKSADAIRLDATRDDPFPNH